MLFKRKPKPGSFIEHSHIANKIEIHNLYEMVFIKPYPYETFVTNQMNEIGPKLYRFTTRVINAAAAYLNRIPAVRKCYGADFTHGVSAFYNEKTQSIEFRNMDDDDRCYVYTKEMVILVQHLFRDLLEKNDWYIFYDGEWFCFKSKSEVFSMKRLHGEDRILWIE